MKHQCVSPIVQHLEISQYPSTQARLVSQEQSREDSDSEAMQTLKTKRYGDARLNSKPSCPGKRAGLGHAVQGISNEGTSSVDELEQLLVG